MCPYEVIFDQFFCLKNIKTNLYKVIYLFCMFCSCRCIECKSKDLEYFDFEASDGFKVVHHTCRSCKTHFNHLDGDTYDHCEECNYNKD